MKRSAPEVAEVSFELVAVTELDELTRMPVAALAPNFTVVVPEARPVPVIVTLVPPEIDPASGETAVTVMEEAKAGGTLTNARATSATRRLATAPRVGRRWWPRECSDMIDIPVTETRSPRSGAAGA